MSIDVLMISQVFIYHDSSEIGEKDFWKIVKFRLI